MTEVLTVLCTCPDPGVAERLGRGLVERRLAACVNILPQVRSIYRWQGAVQDDTEALLVIKTTRQSYPELEGWLQEHHPYDVPEVLAMRVQSGSENYVDWILNETKTR